MSRILLCFVLSLVFQAILADENTIRSKAKVIERDETLRVSVKIFEKKEGADGVRRFEEVLVNFKVTVEEDVVKVNGRLTELDVLTSYELDAEIVYSQGNRGTASVTVEVLVMKNDAENGHQFLIEEKVRIIDGKDVEQLDIKLLTIHINENGKEFDRTSEIISYEKSHMKQRKVKKICGKTDRFPKPWNDSPKLPDEGQNRHHRHHHKKDRKSFCSKFHKLPFAARVAILVGVIIILFSSVLCCTLCCCRKPKNVYEVNKDEKGDFDMEEEAEPLPEKLAFDDKQVLIA